MSIFSMLYNLVIGPLELLFEVIFSFACKIVGHPGLSIIFLSLAMNFLVLPLYKKADEMQAEERDTERKLKPWVTHIKKTFKGDERFMMLQTYYRQNHYKPTHALKGSVSILLEVPFFMAAYHFLSRLELLNGVSFGPIKSLGAPDALLVLGGITINVLPILMTAINLISSAIYTKGLSTRSKVQLYVMALIFLIFLYQSPSGLVFYWTLNNLFSLFKNLFYRLKNPERVRNYAKMGARVALSIGGIIAIIVVLFIQPIQALATRAIAVVLLLFLQVPLGFQLCKKHIKRTPVKETREITVRDKILFYAGCVFLTIMTGVLIPSSVIKASPAEFINLATERNPLLYILNSALIATGTFILWLGVFYMLVKPSCKKKMGLAVWIMSVIAVVDYMFFGTNHGNLSASLKYDISPIFSTKGQILNMLVIVAVCIVIYFVWKKRAELVRVVYFAAGLAAIAMSVFNMSQIQVIASETVDDLQAAKKDMPTIPLSKTGENVVVIMMDRAISGYIPYMFHEKPELQEQFAGFTYYPNTISFGGSTNFGSPALYGGYEYTPTEINKRAEESLESKQNEALKVMPVIFNQEGFKVTVCDPTYAGYSWIPDLSIYDDYPEIHKYITLGKYSLSTEVTSQQEEHILNRNFFCYSIFKISPVVCQPALYGQGTYNEPDAIGGQIRFGLSQSSGVSTTFQSAYAVLKNLPQITDITEQKENTFVMLSNDTTHSPTLLKEPEYEPANTVDNTAYDTAHQDRFLLDGRQLHMETETQMMHYQVNMAGMLQLGKWLDYLRENDVYDNTRIIIVADHGYYLKQFDDMFFEGIDLMAYNPLLMVKDFNSKEFTTDDRFMTNADVPTLATNGLIDNPVNPFTGKAVNSNAKLGSKQYIILSREWDTSINNGNTFMESGWLSVQGNIFDTSSWEKVK